MNVTAYMYVDILEIGLKHFFLSNVIRNARFMQENDPKHTSTLVKAWLEKEEINWWKTLLNHQT